MAPSSTTRKWLGTIEGRLTCQRWYCGHWHINKHIDHIDFLFGDVEEFAAGLKPFDPNAPAKEHSF